MIVSPSGHAIEPQNKAEEVAGEVEKTEEQKRDELLARPFLGVDQAGNLTLHIPFTKTDEITARGMVDMARSRVLEFYAKQARAQAQEQATVAALAAKTGYGRFKDKIGEMMRRR